MVTATTATQTRWFVKPLQGVLLLAASFHDFCFLLTC